MADDVRIGLVGLGRMGRFHAANLAGRVPETRLARIVDAAEDEIREASGRLGDVEWSTRYDELLEDPEVEAVVVASPTPLHAGMAEAAAAAGKHVFCEKPVSLELEPTYRVVEAVLARAADCSYREGRTVRPKREARDGEVFYEEAD